MRERVRRFNRILKIREDDRKAEQAVLAAERGEEMDAVSHLEALETEKTAAIQDFSSAASNGMSSTELWFQRQFIDAINTDISKGQESLTEIRRRIVKTEERLVEKHRDVRVMEEYIGHLKEIAFKEELDAEQIELDDVATMQFARTLRG